MTDKPLPIFLILFCVLLWLLEKAVAMSNAKTRARKKLCITSAKYRENYERIFGRTRQAYKNCKEKPDIMRMPEEKMVGEFEKSIDEKRKIILENILLD